MQVLSDKGFEGGETNGIQLINGSVEKLIHKKKHRIPHLGWNNIKILKKSKILKISLMIQTFILLTVINLKHNLKKILLQRQRMDKILMQS